MKELHRRALASLPIHEDEVNYWFEEHRKNNAFGSVVIERLCISHERLRTELSGAMSMLEELKAFRPKQEGLTEAEKDADNGYMQGLLESRMD